MISFSFRRPTDWLTMTACMYECMIVHDDIYENEKPLKEQGGRGAKYHKKRKTWTDLTPKNNNLESLVLFIGSDSYLMFCRNVTPLLLFLFFDRVLTFSILASLGVHLVGVGEPLELVLVEPLHQPHLHRRQLDRLLCERSVEVAHIHWVFLQKLGLRSRWEVELTSFGLYGGAICFASSRGKSIDLE